MIARNTLFLANDNVNILGEILSQKVVLFEYCIRLGRPWEDIFLPHSVGQILSKGNQG